MKTRIAKTLITAALAAVTLGFAAPAFAVDDYCGTPYPGWPIPPHNSILSSRVQPVLANGNLRLVAELHGFRGMPEFHRVGPLGPGGSPLMLRARTGPAAPDLRAYHPTFDARRLRSYRTRVMR